MLLVLQRIEDISAAGITITAQGFTMTDEPLQFIFSMVPSVLEDLQIESGGQAIVGEHPTLADRPIFGRMYEIPKLSV